MPTERQWKSYSRYLKRLDKIYEKGKVDDCYWLHRPEYWTVKMEETDDVYGRALLYIVRAGRGIDVVLPKELR